MLQPHREHQLLYVLQSIKIIQYMHRKYILYMQCSIILNMCPLMIRYLHETLGKYIICTQTESNIYIYTQYIGFLC